MQTPQKIEDHVRAVAKSLNIDCEMEFKAEGDPFLTKDGKLIDALKDSITKVTGMTPTLGTSGGTSDGRFIRPLGTETVEFGPVANLIHKVDERVSIEEIDKLTEIYVDVLEKLHA